MLPEPIIDLLREVVFRAVHRALQPLLHAILIDRGAADAEEFIRGNRPVLESLQDHSGGDGETEFVGIIEGWEEGALSEFCRGDLVGESEGRGVEHPIRHDFRTGLGCG